MHRCVAVLLLCIQVAGTAFLIAAPIPFPRTPRPWFDGWDKPIDADGDCTFHSAGNKLTITVPGSELGHVMGALAGSHGNAPRLLRDVQGPFAVQVRVDADFQPEEGLAAGILLTDGQQSVTVNRTWWEKTAIAFQGKPAYLDVTSHQPKERTIKGWFQVGPNPKNAAYLQVQRRESELTVKWSEDGNKWTDAVRSLTVSFPRNLKVGVVAESASPQVFKAVFDNWTLKRLASNSAKAEPVRP